MVDNKSAKKKQSKKQSEDQVSDMFDLRPGEVASETESRVHLLGNGIICDTEDRGYATPRNLSPIELLIDVSEGSIWLWAINQTLRWRFQERSMANFVNPEAAKHEIRKLFGEALFAWGDAAPIKFAEDEDVWDFEFVMSGGDNCNSTGCVLASAFFPDSGRHKLVMYPRLFAQSRKEQVDTFIHEVGHIFGLRHFFCANQRNCVAE